VPYFLDARNIIVIITNPDSSPIVFDQPIHHLYLSIENPVGGLANHAVNTINPILKLLFNKTNKKIPRELISPKLVDSHQITAQFIVWL